MAGRQVSTDPFDVRVYVSPSGQRCRLEVGTVSGPWADPMWSVALLDDRGMSLIAGVPAIEHHGAREQARVSYRKRLAALKAAGWRRIGQE